MQAVGSLNYHKTNTHADKTVQDFKCGECDFKSYAKRYVLSHIRKVHRGLNYKHVCEHCGDKFAYPSDLKSHTVIISLDPYYNTIAMVHFEEFQPENIKLSIQKNKMGHSSMIKVN